jgi:hypothetical protein
MQDSGYSPTLSPFEAMLEELQAAIVAGEIEREAELREAVEADLSRRERALGLSS